jgi:ABC-type branched-chain amino acid transport systems, ATPase component
MMPAALRRPITPEVEQAGAPLLEIRDLHVRFGQAHILQGVSLSVGRDPIALVGRNGMGKTTLCQAVMGLNAASAGRSRSRAGRSRASPPIVSRNPASRSCPKEGAAFRP